jgi:hypothetical protein
LTPNPLRTLYPALSSHPLQSLLRGALCERFEQIQGIVEKGAPANREDALVVGARLLKLLEEWNELLGWVSPPFQPLKKQEADSWAAHMVETGWPASQALDFASRVQRKARGGQVSKRPLAVRAFELRRSNPKLWNWSKLADELCNCAGPEHGYACQKSLQTEVWRLKQVLKALAIPLPPELT